ncbi:hypothetical protein FACS1894137_04740 [Spirochaetia bacterium]|nr:hypothetical protein FACS1894137_04740 [Spirochaetia bacterium]
MKYKKLCLFLAGLTLVLSACVNLSKIEIHNFDLTNTADGTYRGKSVVGPVKVVLDVVVKDRTITAINLLQHRKGLGKKAEAIIPKVVEAQSLEVDVVSGATGSSKAILQSIENALKQ